MRHISRVFLVLAVILGPAAASSRAAEIRDLLLLKDSGLGDDILIALIQSDGSVFHLQSADIIDLHQKGLSDRVIVAMLATGRPPAPADQLPAASAAQAPTASPDTVNVPDAPPADRVQVDLPPPDQNPPGPLPADGTEAPAIVPAVVQAGAPMPLPRTEVIEVIVPVPVYVERVHAAPKKAASPAPTPVYLGRGGQKRPGSLDLPGAPVLTAPAKPAPPSGGRGGS